MTGRPMTRRTARDARATRVVDLEHTVALRLADPIAYLRERQAEAEAAYAASGHPDELALVRAFEKSLDGAR